MGREIWGREGTKGGGEIRKKNKGLKKGVGVKRGWKSGWLAVFE